MDAGFLLHELVTSCDNLLLLHYNVVVIDFIPLPEDMEAFLLLKRQGKRHFLPMGHLNFVFKRPERVQLFS